jgi:NhaP-type Na+/H+ or K+/H+ antiporter
MREAASTARMAIVEPVFDAAACLRVGATLAPIDPVELVPIYPREPDAVTLWRARKG